MEISPLEIANICSIFISNRSLKIHRQDLSRYQTLCLLIDSDNSPKKLIDYLIRIGILCEIDEYIYASDIAKNLGKLQGQPNYKLNTKTKDYFIKNILFNTIFVDIGFRSFIRNFKPMVEFSTYGYFRTYHENNDSLNWLKALNSLSLTIISEALVLINKEYLETLNFYLYKLRTGNSVEFDKRDELKNEIGKIAETLAIKYESDRLIKSGFPELAKLIERLSKVDNYLGYDILSFQGSGSNPTRKRYIEVKGTLKNNFQFVFTKNERIVASEKGIQYWIYCFKNVKSALKQDHKPFLICNPIFRLKKMKVYEEPIDIFYSF